MGGSIYWQARSLGIDSKVIFTPDSFSVQQGVTRPVLGEMFNAVDANISTTTGEGWGLTTVEAMAVKNPVLMPDNTTMPEIVGENGYLHKSELDYSFAYGSSNIARPRSNINSLVKDMESVYKDWNKGKYTGQTREKIIKARESIKQYEWANLKEEAGDGAGKGFIHSEETKLKQSISAKHRIKVICEYCNKECSTNLYNRWHGNKCKYNT